ncbi:MAG: hypothetical protein A3F84_02235 [Candidatus Handelsmanbacteria bacterium RIFCSPLOWO2_12_FULL_64_10]|uniref:FHA domain-containing protein n=1 Tax=Handelsmanbacteria sp. (strain RIFCSPLOWO2_12_FULL_64_10) TaxID=1817868 RepID=A0A1F6CL84_HANXR|nr:MAG: hypothetical protein A3F84_02235 [Candidatus Handelsmanbacteria bacterium RIFCSPLOWO2_12_FULL_64_10]
MARIIQRGPSGAQEHLFDGPIRIGRDKNLTISLDDKKCSREHTYFYVVDQDGCKTYWVRDLGSRNGTFVNDQKLSAPAALNPGDVVRVGGTDFVFQADAGEAVAAPAPRRPSSATRQPRVSRHADPIKSAPEASAGGAVARLLFLLVVFAVAAIGAKIFAGRYIDSLFAS